MDLRATLLLACGLAAACTASPLPDAARLIGPAGILGDDMLAIDQAEWAFAVSSRTRNDPAAAAKAVAALDYLAGDLSVSPRWIAVSPILSPSNECSKRGRKRAPRSASRRTPPPSLWWTG